MDARQQRVRALARWIAVRAELLRIMRRALASPCEALLDETSADDEPAHKNALTLHAVHERR